METLPVEINCNIFQNLTDPYEIIQLFKSNAYLASIARDCITRLDWNRMDIIPASFVLGFKNIREVHMPISVKDNSELMALARLKLTDATFYLPDWSLFNVSKRNNINLSNNISFITKWYRV